MLTVHTELVGPEHVRPSRRGKRPVKPETTTTEAEAVPPQTSEPGAKPSKKILKQRRPPKTRSPAPPKELPRHTSKAASSRRRVVSKASEPRVREPELTPEEKEEVIVYLLFGCVLISDRLTDKLLRLSIVVLLAVAASCTRRMTDVPPAARHLSKRHPFASVYC